MAAFYKRTQVMRSLGFFKPSAFASLKWGAWCGGFVVWVTTSSLSAQTTPATNAPSQAPSATTPSDTATATDNAITPTTSTPSSDTPGPDLYKKMSLEELMSQDVTSVSRTPEPWGEAPAAIQVITNDEIRRSGASSLPEALQLADNLEVAQDNAHDWNISARGFNADLSNKLLVLIDGRTVYSPLFSGVIWDVQNVMLEDIDRIEVISGPGGTLWGANAVNGVINIISKSAEETQGWYMEGAGGSELRDSGAIRYGGTLAPNVYYRVYGTYFDRNDEVFTDGAPATDAWSQGKGGFRIDTGGPSDDKFTLQGDYYNGTTGSVAIPGMVDVESGENVVGRWTHTFSPDSDMSLQLYYDRTNLSQPEGPSIIKGIMFEPAGTFSDSLDTYDLDFQHHFQVGDRNQITWGAGYRFTHDQNDNAPTLAFYPAPLNQNLWSFFVQDQIKLQEDLFLTAGTKVEHNDYTGFEVQPSGRLQWNVTPKQMIWAAVSRAVRTPSRIDHDLVEPTGLPPAFKLPSVLTGTTAFTSETLIAYELGYRAQLGDKISGSISTYYNDYTKIRSTTPTAPFGFPIYLQNNLEGETYGVEVSADYQMLDWWRLHAGYDFLKEHIHVTPGEVDFTNGLNETADPQNQFSFRSSMDLPQNIEFDTGLRWVDDLTVNNGPTAATVPSYFELEARLAWHPTKDLEISVVGQNLLHDQHPEYGFPDATQVQIERSVYGKIAWHF
ncbi:TonB-dependent receptor [Methylacidiphilales bacterium]|nr:TonB-dependent receptor [Candidatus Methylacidiphilales bacterium]